MKGNILLVTNSANDLVGVAEQAAKKTERELKMANSCPQTFEILSSGLDDVDLAMVDTAAGLHSLAILEALNYPAAPPVIALVEFDEAEATPILQRHGGAACLRKPFGADELATLIDTVCASARRNEALSCDKWAMCLCEAWEKSRRDPILILNN